MNLTWNDDVIYGAFIYRFYIGCEKRVDQWPLLLTWIKFNPTMNKQMHAQ